MKRLQEAITRILTEGEVIKQRSFSQNMCYCLIEPELSQLCEQFDSKNRHLSVPSLTLGRSKS